jgi:hypothetical protein
MRPIQWTSIRKRGIESTTLTSLLYYQRLKMDEHKISLELDSTEVKNMQPESTSITPASKKAYLVARDGILGYSKQGNLFQPRKMFDVEVVGSLKNKATTVGCVFKVRRVDDTGER